MRFLVTLSLLFLIYSIQQNDCLRIHNNNKKLEHNIKDIPKFKTYYTTQFVDHFNSRDDRTFQERFLLNGKASHVLFSLFNSIFK